MGIGPARGLQGRGFDCRRRTSSFTTCSGRGQGRATCSLPPDRGGGQGGRPEGQADPPIRVHGHIMQILVLPRWRSAAHVRLESAIARQLEPRVKCRSSREVIAYRSPSAGIAVDASGGTLQRGGMTKNFFVIPESHGADSTVRPARGRPPARVPRRWISAGAMR